MNSFDTTSLKPNELTPRLMNDVRVTMTVGDEYARTRGYGYKGSALYKGRKYEIFGADCGADCACDAVAILADSADMKVLHRLLDVGIIPFANND